MYNVTPHTLYAYEGREALWRFTVTDVDGNAVDLTGGSAVFVAQARPARPSDSSALPTLISTEAPTSNATDTLTDAANGEFTIAVEGSVFASLGAADLYWQCWFVDGAGDDALVGWGILAVGRSLAP